MRITAFLLVLALALGAAAQENPGAKTGKARNSLYIVQMSDVPVVSFTGGIAGLQRTKAPKGQKIDPLSPQVLAYNAYLDDKHNRALAAVGGGRKVYDYHFTFNGFAAQLTPAQAEQLKQVDGVRAVTKDELQTQDTSFTPTFLGLTAPGGLWDQLGGFGRAGEDIILGDVDSGIWPESASFSDRTGLNGNATQDGKLGYQQIPGWHGKCTPGEQFPASACSQKLIGAQYFDGAWDGGVKSQRPWEFYSARDYNGHGTHTASTVAGDHGVIPNGATAVFGAISGIAPRVRIAAYKALWSLKDGSSANGFTSDLVAAIDQAVADGVDVINYSISGSTTNFLDPVEVAFLYAADAGVFVSASAGNSGPAGSTVAHPSPWITTTAAGTHSRDGQGSVTIGATTYSGASFAMPVTGMLVDASESAISGASSADAARCFSTFDTADQKPALDPAKVAGKIVLCDRGSNALVNKSFAVQQAGGIGMVLTNVSGGATTLLAVIHSVPTVHLPFSAADYAALHSAAHAGQTAAIHQATIVSTLPAPFTASFSSRGPLRAGAGNLLKPDVIAPGQDILAAVSPVGNGGLDFNLYSGTSMSSPHVVGLAALLKNLHPDWTPMMIKSALMTSAGDVLDGPNTSASVIFSQGAGQVKPNSAADPGLVFNAGMNDWLAFLCGTTNGVAPQDCATLASLGYSLSPNDLNVASIAFGGMLVPQTVTRRVTNVGKSQATYNASVALNGFTTTVTPPALTLKPGETKSFTVNFARTTAPFAAYTGGQLTWSDGSHQVRLPLVLRPIALSAPASVAGTGLPISYNVGFGFDGPFTVAARGLVPPTATPDSVAQGDPTFVPGAAGTVSHSFSIPSGTTYARFSLFAAEVTPGSDLDLYVYKGSTLVGSSTLDGSNEEVNLTNPSGNYTVYVHGWYAPGGLATFTLYNWVLGSADAGNMTIAAPSTGAVGGTGTLNLTFNSLSPGTKYLGSVAYLGSAATASPTIVRVDP